METSNSVKPLTMREKIEALRLNYNQLDNMPVFQQPRCIRSVLGDALELIDDMTKRIELLENNRQSRINHWLVDLTIPHHPPGVNRNLDLYNGSNSDAEKWDLRGSFLKRRPPLGWARGQSSARTPDSRATSWNFEWQPFVPDGKGFGHTATLSPLASGILS